MAELKPEVILTFLGLEADKVKTEEEFKTHFEAKFGIKELLLKDPAFTGKIFGQKIGSIEAKVKANAKKMGVEFTPEEIKDKGVEEILELSFTKIADMNKKAMDDFEKSSKGTVDEQVKTLKESKKAVEDKLRDTEGLLTKTSTEFEGFKKEQVTRVKSDTINNFKKGAINKLEFKQDITPVEKMGFESVLNDKYSFDLDETGSPFVADKKTGQRIASKKETGKFMTADEVLHEELIANKLAKINSQGGRPAPKYGQPLTVDQPASKTLFIHPAALRAAEGR
jgi:hypothetical protein